MLRRFACGAGVSLSIVALLATGPMGFAAGSPPSIPPDDATALPCDVAAAFPYDNQKKSFGVSYNALNAAVAITQCNAAVGEYPTAGRLYFQLGRALEKANKLPAAIAAYQRAGQLGHGGGYNNLGELYRDGKGVVRDAARAEEFFRKGSSLGYAEAEFNLAILLLRQIPSADITQQARQLLVKAAYAGYPDALSHLHALPAASSTADTAKSLVAVKPGLMCVSADALAQLTLPGGTSRIGTSQEKPGDLTLKESGGCVEIPLGARVEVQETRRNTSIVTFRANDATTEKLLIAPNVDFEPAPSNNSFTDGNIARSKEIEKDASPESENYRTSSTSPGESQGANSRESPMAESRTSFVDADKSAATGDAQSRLDAERVREETFEKEAGVTFKLTQNFDEMTDKTVFGLQSIQGNDTGVEAELDATCKIDVVAPELGLNGDSLISFKVLVTDADGKADVHFVDQGGRFLFRVDNGPVQLGPLPYSILLDPREFSNELGHLSLSPSQIKAGWRLLISADTDHGPLMLKVPLRNPVVQKLASLCK